MNLLNNNLNNYISKQAKIIWTSPLNKVLLIITGTLIMLIILINPILNEIVIPKLLISFNQNKKINVDVKHAGYNIFSQNLIIENIHVTTDNHASKDSIDIWIPFCKITNLEILNLIVSNGLSFEGAYVNNTHLFINRSERGNENDSSNQIEIDSFTENILTSIPNRFKPLIFKKLEINNLYFSQIINKREYHDSIKIFEIKFNDLNINSSNVNDSLNLKFADGFNLYIEDLSYHFNNDYLFTLKTLSASSYDSTFIIKNVLYKPYISDNEFFRHRKFSSDRYIIKSSLISIEGINFKKIFWNHGLYLRNILVDKLNLIICTNKTASPDSNKTPKMPNEILQDVKEKIMIKNFKIKNAELNIQAKQISVKKYSEVIFTNINSSIENISNISVGQSSNNACIINVSANLYDSAKLSLEMHLFLLSKNLNFNYTGKLGSMSVLPINNQLEPNDHVKLNIRKNKFCGFFCSCFK